MNESKTNSVVFSAKRDKPLQPPLILNNSIIEDVTVYEHLSLTLSSNLSWRARTVEPLLTDTSLLYGHLSNTDSSLGPGKMPIHSL